MKNNSDIGLVFFYGAGLGKWIWDNLSQNIDYPCLFLDYPGRELNSKDNKGLSLDDYSDFICTKINNWNIDKIVVIAHSIGGVIALKTIRKIKSQIKGFIAISASTPKSGDSYLSSFSTFNRLVMKCVFRLLGTRPPKTALMQSLCNDLSAEQATKVVNQFTPESLMIYEQKVIYNLSDIPKLYIKLTNDKAFREQIQDKMIKNISPKTVVEMNTGHLPMLGKPNDLARIINDFVLKIDK